MNGYLLVDKPKGWTSFDVVAKIRGQVKQQTGQKRPKVGHAGTLDPLATGLLVILVGDYCKRADEFMKLDKVYEVEMELGKTSTTDDAEGELTEISDRQPDLATVLKVLKSFEGTINQVPPVFSAMKIDGQRAYKLARAGKTPEMKPRPVTIRTITDIEYTYPKLSFTTEVTSGTYIRSLVRDLGEKLSTGAYLTELKRTEIGSMSLQNASAPDDPELLNNLLSNHNH